MDKPRIRETPLTKVVGEYKHSTVKNVNIKKREQNTINGIIKMRSWPKEVPIYVYAAHGSDICTDQGILEKRKVPDNCLRVTITQCGDYSYLKNDLVSFLKSTKPRDIYTLRYPYEPDSINHLASSIGVRNIIRDIPAQTTAMDIANLHIRYPGTEYVNSLSHPLGFYSATLAKEVTPLYESMTLTFSGILEKKLIDKVNSDLYLKISYRDLDIEPHIPTPIRKSVFLQMLEDIQTYAPTYKIDYGLDPPSAKIPEKMLQKYDPYSKTVFAAILKELHYYLDKAYTEWNGIPMQRLVAPLLAKQTLLNYLFKDLTANPYEEWPSYTGAQIQTFFTTYLHSFKKSDILDVFSGSIFPNKLYVDSILGYQFPEKEYFVKSNLLEFSALLDAAGGIRLSQLIQKTILEKLENNMKSTLFEVLEGSLYEMFYIQQDKKLPLTVKQSIKVASNLKEILQRQLSLVFSEVFGDTIQTQIYAGYADLLGRTIQSSILTYIKTSSLPVKDKYSKTTLMIQLLKTFETNEKNPLWMDIHKTLQQLVEDVIENRLGNKITSEKLMILYPGIHYNTSCRVLSCKSELAKNFATRRRRHSMTNENFRRAMQKEEMVRKTIGYEAANLGVLRMLGNEYTPLKSIKAQAQAQAQAEAEARAQAQAQAEAEAEAQRQAEAALVTPSSVTKNYEAIINIITDVEDLRLNSDYQYQRKLYDKLIASKNILSKLNGKERLEILEYLENYIAFMDTSYHSRRIKELILDIPTQKPRRYTRRIKK